MRAALFLLSTSLIAADAGFTGRWNLTVENEPRSRAWWLEVKAPTGGRFVGFPGGDLNPISNLKIAGNELTFSYRADGRTIAYRARLDKGILRGEAVEGSTVRRFTGARAPQIAEKDDATWRRGKAIELFDGRSLDGWSAVVKDKPPGWSVRKGLLANTAAANNLASNRKFWNFELHAEYRLREGSNSGIGLRGRYEVQIQDDYGKPPESHGHGALYSRIAPSSNPSKKPGEWQTLDIRLVGRIVTVRLNGTTVINHREIEGLTAMATDPNEATPGPITIQGDHKEVEFRKLTVTPLEK